MTQTMPLTLADVWRRHIIPEDYDAHMSRAGQTRANAEILYNLLMACPPGPGPIWVAGAGTGSYLTQPLTIYLRTRDMILSDVSHAFACTLRHRLHDEELNCALVVVDDLGESSLRPGFAAVVFVLVLEHVGVGNAVAAAARLGIPRCYVITQRNPSGVAAAAAGALPPVGSMALLATV